MAKKRSAGTILFGILFIILAVQLLNLPLGYLLASSPAKESTPGIIYDGYMKRIQRVEELEKNWRAQLEASKNSDKFYQKLIEFKTEAANFKEKYLIQRKLLPTNQFFIFVGFLSCMMYLIGGVGLLIHFPWARRFALWCIYINVIFYLSFLWDTYSVSALSNSINGKMNALEILLNPNIKQLNLSNADDMKSVLSVFAICHIVVLTYIAVVIFYFTRPKVKERFLVSTQKKLPGTF